ncbi:MAG TPA: hypothetical protein VHV83_10850 [Armatimonadota bacterium]|nr:hypothetical protein [Armatimonadota bacterium]
MALIAIIVALLPIQAQLWTADHAKSHPATFLSGIATGILVHELGHVTVASAKGYHVDMNNLTIVYPGAVMSDADHLQVASAGFQAQWLLSEAVLDSHELQHTPTKLNDFAAGLVCSHLATTAAYLLVLKNQPGNDITGISEGSGLSRDSIALFVAIPAALDYWRLTGHNVPKWVPALSATSKGLGISASWTF